MVYLKKNLHFEKIGNQHFINQVFKTLAEPDYIKKIIKKKEEINQSINIKKNKRKDKNKNRNVNDSMTSNKSNMSSKSIEIPEDKIVVAFDKIPKVIDFVSKNKNDFLQLSISKKNN